MIQVAPQKISIPNKALRLVQILESELGHGKFVEGQRFLSTHEIARCYNVSPGTARKALVELVGRGYLESAERSGHYLRQRSASSTPPSTAPKQPASATALLMIVGASDQWGVRLLDQYMAALEQACDAEGWQLLKVNNRAEEIAQATKDRHVVGCLAYGLSGPPAVDVDPARVISWNSPWCDPAWSLLGPDRENASLLAFEHLWDMGHHHTALVRQTPHGNLVREGRGLVLGMRKAYASMGLKWRSRDVITLPSPDGRALDDQECEALLKRLGAQEITGIYCISWPVVVAIYRLAHRRGTPWRELSVIASGGHDLADLMTPRPARIYWRFTDYGMAAVKALRRLDKGQPLPHRIRIPVFLQEGASVHSLISEEDQEMK